MGRKRRTAWIAAAWLLCQAVALTLPLAAGAMAAEAEVCTCPGGTPGAPCPMHHHGLTPEQQNAPAFRNGCAQPDVTLLALAGGLGVLPRDVVVSIIQTPTVISPIVTRPVQRTEVPDAPPPRA
jgi:hypothetical protein